MNDVDVRLQKGYCSSSGLVSEREKMEVLVLNSDTKGGFWYGVSKRL